MKVSFFSFLQSKKCYCDSKKQGIDERLLSVLVCPSSQQALRWLLEDELPRLNSAVEMGFLCFRNGTPVRQVIKQGLIREDEKILYVCEDGIPVLLKSRGIRLLWA
ncbi:MAG: hypothetical protein R3F23_08830 [Verrucomicrobiia bacterium]